MRLRPIYTVTKQVWHVDDPGEYFESLVTKLIYQHGHSNAKKRRVVIKRHMANGLDFPEVDEVIEAAAEELEFVHCTDEIVWYDQNEALILFLRDETSHDLAIIGANFSHLTPPSLRDKYNLPRTR